MTLIHYLLALLPIAGVLYLMLARRWGARNAGIAGWLTGLVVAMIGFGLTLDVFAVSQVKSLLLSANVLYVFWPALFMYNVIAQTGGIQALSRGLERTIADSGLRLVMIAWAFGGILEGLAGFGIPVAVGAPLLVGLGVNPVVAVAAAAIGHAWAVTFGNMGVVFQTLQAITRLDAAILVPTCALMLGAACIGCGLAAAHLLGQGKRWLFVIVIGLIMAGVQAAIAMLGLTSLAALGAGLVGIVAGAALSRIRPSPKADSPRVNDQGQVMSRPMVGTLASYSAVVVVLGAVALIPSLKAALNSVAVLQFSFPQVTTSTGFVTQAGSGQIIRLLTHPGTTLFSVGLVAGAIFIALRMGDRHLIARAAQITVKTAWPSTVGVLSMVGLSAIMDHTGMTLLLAQGLSNTLGAVFPVVSPLVGILGAFATGSNNNSNVLFAPLQQNAALLLMIPPQILLAAQTTGGALGSMIAPAKIIVGCSTVGIIGRDGDVLRRTVGYAVLLALTLGILTLILSLAR